MSHDATKRASSASVGIRAANCWPFDCTWVFGPEDDMRIIVEGGGFVGSALARSPSLGLLSLSAFLALTMVTAGAASGQTVATSFEQLRFKVKAGDTVFVTDDGASEREARILDLTSAVLAVSIDGVRYELAESSVRRIRQRVPDSRKNGALIGSLVGAAGSAAGAIAMASPAGSCTGGCVAGNVLIGGGLGSLVGLGIDALIQRRKDVYVKSGQASLDIDLSPVVSSHVRGVRVLLQF
jgi:hypothetical protein